MTSQAGDVVVSYYACEGKAMEDVGDCSSSDTPGSLSLSYSSSSFEWSDRSDSATEADDPHGSAAVEPFQYEPEVSESSSSEEDSSEEDDDSITYSIHNAVIPIGNIDSLLTGNSLVGARDGSERKSE